MSPSYTGETTMNEAAFRDVERSSQIGSDVRSGHSEVGSDRGFEPGPNLGPWRDKIEVRLDNRQVFFLFFGSALCACMLFVLGVIVGKRLESRGRAAIPEVQDPLAVLDRINSVGTGASNTSPRPEPALTFPKALLGSSTKSHAASPPSPRVAALPPATAAVAKVPRPPKAPVPLPKASPPAPRAPAVAAASRSVAVASVRLVALAAPKPAPPVAPAVAPALSAAAAAAAAKGKFTLVLSSFPERAEADAFAKRFASQGAYVTVADAPGKGGIYRVRVGNYASPQEALAAKGMFEKQTNTIAYIAGR
jgi:hypothetical protein